MSLSDGALDPSFQSDRLDYEATVDDAVTEITVTATSTSNVASIAIDGAPAVSGAASDPISLQTGDNPIDIVVTAEDGVTRRVYTVVVTREAPPSDNAALASLALSAGTLDQLFDPTITSYSASLGHLATAIRITASPEDQNASLVLNGDPIPADVPSPYVALNPGDNVISLEVTAEDGTTTRAYDITVSRAALNTVQQQAYVKASNPDADYFATSVSISGDWLVAGSPGEGSAATGLNGDEADDSLFAAGAAYVFRRNGSDWMQTDYVKASNTGSGDRFAGKVLIHDDMLIVGAEGEQSLTGDQQDDSGSFVGAAYVFERDDMDVWSQTAYLKASNADSGDEFGRFMDFDGETLIAAARYESSAATGVNGDEADDSLSDAGAAYIFGQAADGSWSQQAYLKASNPDSGDWFGRSVAVSGHLAAVGAPLEDSAASGVGADDTDNSGDRVGAVYLFEADASGVWAPAAYVKASNADSRDRFGLAVDLDGGTLVVGAPGEGSLSGTDPSDNSATSAGAVYVFELDAAGSWTETAYIKASNAASFDDFGVSVALQGNLLAVGALSESSDADGIGGDQSDDSASMAGAVYLFERDATGSWQQIAYVKASNSDLGDEFGVAVALDGDTLVVGSELERSASAGVNGDEADNSLPGAGAAYVIR